VRGTVATTLNTMSENDLGRTMPPYGPPFRCARDVTFASDTFSKVETGCRGRGELER